jgi:hypothetical protein
MRQRRKLGAATLSVLALKASGCSRTIARELKGERTGCLAGHREVLQSAGLFAAPAPDSEVA